jgi:hypothetical protein
VRVVDQAQHRRVAGRLSEQAEQPERDQVGALNQVEAQAERTAQRGLLRGGQPVQPSQAGPQQLVQAGERELVLGLDAGAPQYGHIPGVALGVAEERGLPDPGLAAEYQHGAAATARLLQQLIDDTLLSFAPQQHAAMVGRH